MGKSKNEIQKEYEKRTNYEAKRKYNKEKTKLYTFRFVKITEQDLIDQIEKQENKSGYIKMLIKQDIEKNKIC